MVEPNNSGLSRGRIAAIAGLVALIGFLALAIYHFCFVWIEPGHFHGPVASPADRKHVLKVLFIGNSYTYVNDLPGAVEALSKASGQDPVIQVQGLTAGGATLQVHWDTGAATAIRGTDWNFVVLQEQSLTPLAEVGRDKLFFPYARKFDEVIKARGATALFYMTWKRPDSQAPQESWTAPYLDITRELGAQVAPAGMALELLLSRKPDFKFYADEGGHPTPAGTYLVACTFYSAIYNKSPVGLPATVTTASKQSIGVAPEDAPLVQGVAWEALEAAQARLKSK